MKRRYFYVTWCAPGAGQTGCTYTRGTLHPQANAPLRESLARQISLAQGVVLQPEGVILLGIEELEAAVAQAVFPEDFQDKVPLPQGFVGPDDPDFD